MKTLPQKKIIDWIAAHPAINIRALEKECNVPESTIKMALSGSRELPDKHLEAIKSVLKKYGY
jgi:hypothetical protein